MSNLFGAIMELSSEESMTTGERRASTYHPASQPETDGDRFGNQNGRTGDEEEAEHSPPLRGSSTSGVGARKGGGHFSAEAKFSGATERRALTGRKGMLVPRHKFIGKFQKETTVSRVSNRFILRSPKNI